MSTTEKLDAIQARADKATGTRWGYGEHDWPDDTGIIWATSDAQPFSHLFAELPAATGADIDFILNAREDVPALVGALRAVLDLANHWSRLAGEAMNQETRDWLSATSLSLRKAIEDALP